MRVRIAQKTRGRLKFKIFVIRETSTQKARDVVPKYTRSDLFLNLGSFCFVFVCYRERQQQRSVFTSFIHVDKNRKEGSRNKNEKSIPYFTFLVSSTFCSRASSEFLRSKDFTLSFSSLHARAMILLFFHETSRIVVVVFFIRLSKFSNLSGQTVYSRYNGYIRESNISCCAHTYIYTHTDTHSM